MYTGWFCLGGNEIINNSRAIAYARSAGCPVNWFVDDPDLSIIQMTEGALKGYSMPWYDYADIEGAPWFDDSWLGVHSTEFLGAYCLSTDGLYDATREASSAQRTDSGSVIGRERAASRRVRFRVMLTALSEAGLEYGMAWLSTAIGEAGCSTHQGSSCGTSDMTFYNAVIPDNELWSPDAGYSAGQFDVNVDLISRRMHGVKTVSGPLTQQDLRSNISSAVGRIVEFTVEAEQAFLYGIPLEVRNPVVGYTRVLDDPLNLSPVPSLQDVTGTAIVMRNYCTNPSVETNNTGWTVLGDGAVILNANVVGARSTEIAAVGVASQRATWTAPGASAVAGWFGTDYEVVLPHAVFAGERYSISMWATGNIQTGAPVLGDLEIVAYWRLAGATLRTDSLGVVEGGSGPRTLQSVVPPAGATSVIVRARQYVNSWAAGNVVRLYADALSVSVP